MAAGDNTNEQNAFSEWLKMHSIPEFLYFLSVTLFLVLMICSHCHCDLPWYGRYSVNLYLQDDGFYKHLLWIDYVFLSAAIASAGAFLGVYASKTTQMHAVR